MPKDNSVAGEGTRTKNLGNTSNRTTGFRNKDASICAKLKYVTLWSICFYLAFTIEKFSR